MALQTATELIYEYIYLELCLVCLKYYYTYVVIQQILVVPLGSVKQSVRCWESRAGYRKAAWSRAGVWPSVAKSIEFKSCLPPTPTPGPDFAKVFLFPQSGRITFYFAGGGGVL